MADHSNLGRVAAEIGSFDYQKFTEWVFLLFHLNSLLYCVEAKSHRKFSIFSVSAESENFFVYTDRLGCHHARLELHIILELVRQWLSSTEAVDQVAMAVNA